MSDQQTPCINDSSTYSLLNRSCYKKQKSRIGRTPPEKNQIDRGAKDSNIRTSLRKSKYRKQMRTLEISASSYYDGQFCETHYSIIEIPNDHPNYTKVLAIEIWRPNILHKVISLHIFYQAKRSVFHENERYGRLINVWILEIFPCFREVLDIR